MFNFNRKFDYNFDNLILYNTIALCKLNIFLAQSKENFIVIKIFIQQKLLKSSFITISFNKCLTNILNLKIENG